MDALEGTQINILLVEDNPDDVLLTTKLLKHAKLMNSIAVVNDGEEALAYLLQEGEFASALRPDLVLLDLNLPKKSGNEVLAAIRSNPTLCSITVVIQSASDDETELLKNSDFSADCYVTKPVDLDKMIQIVSSVEDFGLSVVSAG
ncbi:MAG: response regulator [Actinobacteria bacterium]|nr:response regulator [Actinomycetota bacterium]MCL5883694.1 response regulator [Actinomycetota bacterium]